MATQSEEFLDNTGASPVSRSQGTEGTGSIADIQYYWLITFQHSISVQNPFHVQLISSFAKEEILSVWLSDRFTVHERLRKFKFEGMHDESSVFCRIERGQ